MENRPIQPHGRHGLPAGRQISGVYFSKVQLERLDAIAEKQDLSRSVLIRRAVDQFLQGQEG